MKLSVAFDVDGKAVGGVLQLAELIGEDAFNATLWVAKNVSKLPRGMPLTRTVVWQESSGECVLSAEIARLVEDAVRVG